MVNGQPGLATHKFAMFAEWPNVFGLLKEAGFRTWQKEVGDPFADPANIRGWIAEQERGREINYGKKGVPLGLPGRVSRAVIIPVQGCDDRFALWRDVSMIHA